MVLDLSEKMCLPAGQVICNQYLDFKELCRSVRLCLVTMKCQAIMFTTQSNIGKMIPQPLRASKYLIYNLTLTGIYL